MAGTEGCAPSGQRLLVSVADGDRDEQVNRFNGLLISFITHYMAVIAAP